MLYKNDKELFSLLKGKLYTSVVGDILDKMGYLHQFLPQEVRPLKDDMIIAGRAMPVLEADVTGFVTEGSQNKLMEKNFGLMLEALDAIEEDEVYLCPSSSLSYALIGEIMCTRMNKRGAAGAVVNGFHRDTRGILALNMPVFSRGPYAKDQGPQGKVIDFRVPIEAGGVRVNPGDIVFGDYLAHQTGEVAAHLGITGIEKPLAGRLLAPRPVTGYHRGAALFFHLPVGPNGKSDQPGMALHGPLVTLVDDKGQRVVSRIAATAQHPGPRLILRSVEHLAPNARLEKDGIDTQRLQAVEYLDKFLLLPTGIGRRAHRTRRPVQPPVCREPYGPHLVFGRRSQKCETCKTNGEEQ